MATSKLSGLQYADLYKHVHPARENMNRKGDLFCIVHLSVVEASEGKPKGGNSESPEYGALQRTSSYRGLIKPPS